MVCCQWRNLTVFLFQSLLLWLEDVLEQKLSCRLRTTVLNLLSSKVWSTTPRIWRTLIGFSTLLSDWMPSKTIFNEARAYQKYSFPLIFSKVNLLKDIIENCRWTWTPLPLKSKSGIMSIKKISTKRAVKVELNICWDCRTFSKNADNGGTLLLK